MTQTAAHPDTTSTLMRNKAIAENLLSAIARGDIADIEELLHPQLIWWVLGYGELGREQFIASLTRTIRSSSHRHIEIAEVTAEQDRVAVIASGRFDMATTRYCNDYHYLFTIRDNKIIYGREYLNTLEAARVFGAQSS